MIPFAIQNCLKLLCVRPVDQTVRKLGGRYLVFGRKFRCSALTATVLCIFALSANGKDRSAPSVTGSQSCLEAARKALGARAVVLKCDVLDTPGIREVIAVLPAKLPHNEVTGMAILKMVILRHELKRWRPALMVARQIRNRVGYIGIEYIDDYSPFYGYWLRFSDTRSDGKKAFDIDLTWIDSANGTTESASTEIAWNPLIGRYQEFTVNQDPEGFQPEVKNPPHWRLGVKLPGAPGK
jgi:hypothetical protein